jgi:hypothetical protein
VLIVTPPKKPEWFQLAESDGIQPRASVKRSARGALLALPLLLIGVGVFVAQSTDESPVLAETVTTVASAAPEINAAPTSPAIKSSSVMPPAIATPPTGGGDDDDDDEYDDEYEDDEDEEDDD